MCRRLISVRWKVGLDLRQAQQFAKGPDGDYATDDWIPILAEDGCVPHIRRKPDKPVEQIVVELLHRLPLRTHCIKRLQQQVAASIAPAERMAIYRPRTVATRFGQEELDCGVKHATGGHNHPLYCGNLQLAGPLHKTFAKLSDRAQLSGQLWPGAILRIPNP